MLCCCLIECQENWRKAAEVASPLMPFGTSSVHLFTGLLLSIREKRQKQIFVKMNKSLRYWMDLDPSLFFFCKSLPSSHLSIIFVLVSLCFPLSFALISLLPFVWFLFCMLSSFPLLLLVLLVCFCSQQTKRVSLPRQPRSPGLRSSPTGTLQLVKIHVHESLNSSQKVCGLWLWFRWM